MLLRYILGLLILGLYAPSIWAQRTGTCTPAQAEAILETRNVRAILRNDGRLTRYRTGYEVPKGSNVHLVFGTSLMVGGYVDSTLRISGAAESLAQFWAGPLDTEGQPPLDCTAYDRIYRVSLDDIEAYNATGYAAVDLAEWPIHLGAPVLDGDGNPHNYDLAAGDRPAMLGDQMAWWIMNDLGNESSLVKGLPSDPRIPSQAIGLEIQVTAFGYDVPGLIGSSTFYRYTLAYKGASPLEDAFVGFYVDPDFGEAYDDFVGSDTTLHMAYVYNGDNDDEESYGLNPPALGYVWLQGPAPSKSPTNFESPLTSDASLGMTTFMCLHKSGRFGRPSLFAPYFYNVLQGLYSSGEPMLVGGDGGKHQRNPFGFKPTTKHCYPGKPEDRAFWSEMNADGEGTRNSFFDTRFSFSSGPFRMEPSAPQTLAFAIIWSQGADHLDSVRQLRKDAAYVRSVAQDLYTVSPTLLNAPKQPDALPPPLTFTSNYPNPFSSETTIRYSLPIAASVYLAVYDALGQEIAVLVNQEQSPNIYTATFAVETLPPGVYFYRLVLNGHYTFTKAMLHIR